MVSALRLAALLRRTRRAGAWLVPAALFAVIPKCPLCLAAYVALGTGIGLSFETAARLRWALLALAFAALAFLVTRTVQRWVARRAASRNVSGVRLPHAPRLSAARSNHIVSSS